MKITLRIIVIVAIFFGTLEISTYCYRRIYAESIATEMVHEECREQNYDLTKLSGPIKEGHPPSYSWIYKDSTHHLEFLVAFDTAYDGKVALWDFDRKD